MPRFLQLIGAGSLVCLVGVGGCQTFSRQPPGGDWAYFGGDKAFTRYAPLDQITRDNVGDLQILWRRPAVDPAFMESFPDLRVSGNLRATPILIDGVLYAPNGVGLVEAFHPATGETLWVQEPFAQTLQEAAGQSSRGVDYWAEGADGRLIAVRANLRRGFCPFPLFHHGR